MNDTALNRASKILNHTNPVNQSTDESTDTVWLSLQTDEIKACIHPNGLAEIILNRPKALNSLTENMVTVMLSLLTAWQSDNTVKLVLVTGSGKAFCAGGDLKGLLSGGKSAPDCSNLSNEELLTVEPNRFLRTEYTLDLLTSQFSKPYVSLCHGMTIGGGVGISMHGSYRIVCEDTRVAMPEVLIGLIPDVGGSYFLSRFPGQTGMFCALTSHYLDVADQIYTKAGTHFVPRSRHEALLSYLRGRDFHQSPSAKDALNAVLHTHQQKYDMTAHPSFLARHKHEIDDLFRGHSIASIKQRIAAVCNNNDDLGRFAAQCRVRMDLASPTSLLLTFESLRRARRSSLAQCLLFEYRIMIRCARAAALGGDFYEGVRAKILEKDNLPKWNRPLPLLHVHDMFLPLAHNEGPELVFTEMQLKRSDDTRR